MAVASKPPCVEPLDRETSDWTPKLRKSGFRCWTEEVVSEIFGLHGLRGSRWGTGYRHRIRGQRTKLILAGSQAQVHLKNLLSGDLLPGVG